MVYELRYVAAEVKIEDKAKIEPGFALNYNMSKNGNGETDLIASYDTLEEAKADLASRSSSVTFISSYSSKFYLFEEYFIEDAEYNEDGDWIGGGDIYEYSKLKEDE